MPFFDASVFNQDFHGLCSVHARVKAFDHRGRLYNLSLGGIGQRDPSVIFTRRGPRAFRNVERERGGHAHLSPHFRGGALQIHWYFSVRLENRDRLSRISRRITDPGSSYPPYFFTDRGRAGGSQSLTWRYPSHSRERLPEFTEVREMPTRNTPSLNNFAVSFSVIGQKYRVCRWRGEIICRASLSVSHSDNTTNALSIAGSYARAGVQLGWTGSRSETVERGANVVFNVAIPYTTERYPEGMYGRRTSPSSP